jgi:hypothetical protein
MIDACAQRAAATAVALKPVFQGPGLAGWNLLFVQLSGVHD